MSVLQKGDIPLVSAKDNNNGLKNFVKPSKETIQGGCISLNNDGDGGAGLAYYQPHEMALDSHVTALIPRQAMNQHTSIFIAKCLSGLHDYYGHGLSISNARAKSIMIMLPMKEAESPDYSFMENYVRKIIKNKYQQYLNYVRKTGVMV